LSPRQLDEFLLEYDWPVLDRWFDEGGEFYLRSRWRWLKGVRPALFGRYVAHPDGTDIFVEAKTPHIEMAGTVLVPLSMLFIFIIASGASEFPASVLVVVAALTPFALVYALLRWLWRDEAEDYRRLFTEELGLTEIRSDRTTPLQPDRRQSL
jgi:hypothetical protein